MATKECRPKFSDEFFDGVGFVAKPSGKIPVDPVFMARPMDVFMGEDGIVTFRLGEPVEVRRPDRIGFWRIGSDASSMTDFRLKISVETLLKNLPRIIFYDGLTKSACRARLQCLIY